MLIRLPLSSTDTGRRMRRNRRSPPVLLDARRANQLHERFAAAVQNGHLQVVDLDVRVVDAHAVEHTQQMLGGRDQHALTASGWSHS